MTQDNKPWKGMIRAVNYTCVNADGNPETNHYLALPDPLSTVLPPACNDY